MPAARLAIMADDTNYGSLGALAPNWSDGERNIDTDEIYERFFEWVADVKGVGETGGTAWYNRSGTVMHASRQWAKPFEYR